jgi:CubicO group peptidase (beta-lactamase class C family)
MGGAAGALFATGRSAFAQTADGGDAIPQARTVIKTAIEKNHLPGFCIAVARSGKTLWSEALGKVDLENDVPATTASLFRLGSVSKLLTIAGVAKLHQQGKLDLDAPVQKYVPYFPQKAFPVTARQLAAHIGGIRGYRESDQALPPKTYNSVQEGLQIFANDSLASEPGTKYEYSSYGFNLLSAVVEGASGQDFLSYMRDNVFEPLGMDATVPDKNSMIIPRRVRFYYFDSKTNQMRNAPYVDNSYKWASGGFLSTAEDLLRLGMAFQGPGFFTAATLKLVFTPQHLRSGAEAGTSAFSVGLGWRISRDADGNRFFHHAGAIEGGRSVLRLDEARRTAIALLANNFENFGEKEAGQIAVLFAAA